jgi:radical SAM protein with 4Fe4S-binding SPASM domain
MGKHGVKALMLGGEGEPLLHKNSVDIIKTCKENGINVAITTNGGPMTKKFSEEALKYVTWVKVSIDAGNPEDHAHIHGTSNKDFDMILENIEDALEVKRRQGLKTEIGAQALLFDENMSSVEELAWRLSDLNGELNHFVIKPYTSHPYRKERDYEFTGDYSEMTFPDDLNVILRKATFDRLDIAREYVECHALDFWSYIASDGEVYSCSNFLGNKKYSYGNINNKLFSDIWKEKSTKDIDMKNCRAICRMDKVNVYLDKVKNMTENMYFI